MGGKQNSGIVSNNINIHFICDADNNSNNLQINNDSKPSEIAMFLDNVKKNENKTVCVCIKYKDKDNHLKPVCLRTKYQLCSIPDRLKLQVADEMDLENASVLAQPPSKHDIIESKNLVSKYTSNLSVYNLETFYSCKMESPLCKEAPPKKHRKKDEMVKSKSDQCPERKNTKDCENSSELSSNLNADDKNFKFLFHDTDVKHRVKQKNKSDKSKNKKRSCNERYCCPIKDATLQENDTKSKKKENNLTLKEDCIKSSQSKRMRGCLNDSTKVDSDKTITVEGKHLRLVSLRRDKENPDCGVGILNVSGKDYNACFDLSNVEKVAEKQCTCSANAYCRQNKKHSQTKHKISTPLDYKIKCMVLDAIKGDSHIGLKMNESTPFCPCVQKENVKKGIKNSQVGDNVKKDCIASINSKLMIKLPFGSNYKTVPFKFVEGLEEKPIKKTRENWDFDGMPGFSFKLKKGNLEGDDDGCLIRDNEWSRVTDKKIEGLQPKTIIMNAPYNLPLRIYEISPKEMTKYLSI